MVVEAFLPERVARHGVELAAGRVLGKARARQRDVPLQHQREAPPHLGARLADSNRAGHIGGAVGILAAGIQQEQLALAERAVARCAHPVVHDGAVGPRAGDGVEGEIAQLAGLLAEGRETLGGLDLGERILAAALRSGLVEPMQEAAEGGAVAAVGAAHAIKFGGVLAGLGRSEEHTSELQSLMRISYAVFCLQKTINKVTIWY